MGFQTDPDPRPGHALALINSSRSKGLAKLALPLVAPGLAASIGAAVLLGAAGYAFTAVSVVALSGGIIMVPLRYYPALVLLALVIVPAVNLSLEAETPILLKPLAGQASAVFVLGTASLGRFLISGRRFRLPFFVWSALGLYIVFIGATLLVGAVQDSLADSFVDDSRRKLTYMLAVFVGAIAVTDGGSGWQHKNLIAPVAGLSAALSIWYWLWANVSLPAPPFLTELFENAAGAFAYGAALRFPFQPRFTEWRSHRLRCAGHVSRGAITETHRRAPQDRNLDCDNFAGIGDAIN